MQPTPEMLRAIEARNQRRRRHGQAVLDRIAAEKGRPARITDFESLESPADAS